MQKAGWAEKVKKKFSFEIKTRKQTKEVNLNEHIGMWVCLTMNKNFIGKLLNKLLRCKLPICGTAMDAWILAIQTRQLESARA